MATARWLADLTDRARVPDEVERRVVVGELESALAAAPQSDLDVMRLPATADVPFLRARVVQTRSACLFASDSGQESALA